MPQPLIIDVRSEEEFEHYPREGAINIPLDKIKNGDLGILAETPHDVVVQCCCLSGARSAIACEILRKLGFRNVTNIGGL